MILFTWIQLLKEEALDFLGIQSPLEIVRGGSKASGERRKTDPEATGTVWVLLKECVCFFTRVGASASAKICVFCYSITTDTVD